jgi:hypothetical protein
MIQLNALHNLLNIKEDEIKKLDMEQLRLMLGIFRYLTRVIEREINEREPLVK